MQDADLPETYDSLLDAVEKARGIHEQSHALFCSVASRTRQLPRLPGGLAEPADHDPIREAFFSQREAARQYADALHRLNRCVAANHLSTPESERTASPIQTV